MIRLTDFSGLQCDPLSSIREVMKRISACPYLFQVVVDRSGRVLGTVTDGDIRRAILKGKTLDTEVQACMHSNPITGYLNENFDSTTKLNEITGLVAFLPIVDEENVLREILVNVPDESEPSALVMAGGFGRRLGELTRDTPKPLLPINDKPILEHILDRLEASGFKKIFISVHFMAEKIQTFVDKRENQAEIHLLHEHEPRGTAGALALLPASSTSPILVLNGDVITNLDLTALITFHNRHAYDGTLAVAQHEVTIPFGVVVHSDEGVFLGVNEKPAVKNFVSAGVYYLSPEFISLVPEGRQMDMPELLNLGRDVGLNVGLFPIHEYWRDIGNPDDLQRADKDFS